MDIQIVKTVTIHLDMNQDELTALRDLVARGAEEMEKGRALDEDRAKVVGDIFNAYAQTRRG